MPQATLFTEAYVGLDPYSPKAWSGCATYIVESMKRAGLLEAIVPLPLPRVKKALLLAKNYSRERDVWRRHFYFDLAYRNAVTAVARSKAPATPICMQFGAMFSLPQAFPDKKCISYHDGNLAERVDSGFGLPGVSAKRIEQSLRYEEEVAQEMTAIFTFSEFLRQSFIRNYHVSGDKVFHVGAAVNLTEVPEVNAAKVYNKRILFVGGEFVRKGGSQLLEAFRVVRSVIPEAELNIVGPAHLDCLPDGVVFHGHLSKADPEQKAKLESLFRECSLFVLPSLYEPFGIAPLEAMLYQLPCVVTNEWALKECVTPRVNGALVEKGSSEDLAVKLIDMLSDRDRLAAMGRNAREVAFPHYTWPAVADRMASAMGTI